MSQYGKYISYLYNLIEDDSFGWVSWSWEYIKKKKKEKTFSPLSLTERPKQFLKGWIDMIKALS